MKYKKHIAIILIIIISTLAMTTNVYAYSTIEIDENDINVLGFNGTIISNVNDVIELINNIKDVSEEVGNSEIKDTFNYWAQIYSIMKQKLGFYNLDEFKDITQAVELYKQYMTENGNSLPVRDEKGNILFNDKFVDDTYTYLQTMVAINSSNTMYLNTSSKFYTEMKFIDEMYKKMDGETKNYFAPVYNYINSLYKANQMFCIRKQYRSGSYVYNESISYTIIPLCIEKNANKIFYSDDYKERIINDKMITFYPLQNKNRDMDGTITCSKLEYDSIGVEIETWTYKNVRTYYIKNPYKKDRNFSKKCTSIIGTEYNAFKTEDYIYFPQKELIYLSGSIPQANTSQNIYTTNTYKTYDIKNDNSITITYNQYYEDNWISEEWKSIKNILKKIQTIEPTTVVVPNIDGTKDEILIDNELEIDKYINSLNIEFQKTINNGLAEIDKSITAGDTQLVTINKKLLDVIIKLGESTLSDLGKLIEILQNFNITKGNMVEEILNYLTSVLGETFTTIMQLTFNTLKTIYNIVTAIINEFIDIINEDVIYYIKQFFANLNIRNKYDVFKDDISKFKEYMKIVIMAIPQPIMLLIELVIILFSCIAFIKIIR